MKGLISRAAAVLCLAAGLGSFTGCGTYRDCVDPCWPERYNSVARHSTNELCANQVNNGHILNQTVWNHHFEAGTDRLTPGGLDHLGYLSRVRPQAENCRKNLSGLSSAVTAEEHPGEYDRELGQYDRRDMPAAAQVNMHRKALPRLSPQLIGAQPDAVQRAPDHIIPGGAVP